MSPGRRCLGSPRPGANGHRAPRSGELALGGTTTLGQSGVGAPGVLPPDRDLYRLRIHHCHQWDRHSEQCGEESENERGAGCRAGKSFPQCRQKTALRNHVHHLFPLDRESSLAGRPEVRLMREFSCSFHIPRDREVLGCVLETHRNIVAALSGPRATSPGACRRAASLFGRRSPGLVVAISSMPDA